jgi:integrase
MTKRANGDGDIWPRRNKAGQITSYRGAYYGPDGNRRYVSGKTKEDARRKLRKARGDADRGLVSDGGSVKFSAYLKRWLNDSVRGSVKPITHECYAMLVNKHVIPAIGNVRLSNLTPAHLQGFHRSKLDAGLSPRTVQYLHVVLDRALKQALRWGLVPRNVAEAVDPPKVPKKDVTPLSPDQARVLLEAARGDRLEALYVLAVHTGMRQGELLALKWEHVDLDAGVLRVRGTKTARSRRTVKVFQTALDALTSHLTRQLGEIDRVGNAWRENGLVFASEIGAPLNRHNLTQRSFRPLLERAGLPRVRFHDLRHTCATILLSKGVHAKFVQELLGHATIAIPLDTYSHVLPGMGGSTADAMDDAFAPKSDALLPRCCQSTRNGFRGLTFSRALQVIKEWRDPDSNRGHHDFQLEGLCS